MDCLFMNNVNWNWMQWSDEAEMVLFGQAYQDSKNDIIPFIVFVVIPLVPLVPHPASRSRLNPGRKWIFPEENNPKYAITVLQCPFVSRLALTQN